IFSVIVPFWLVWAFSGFRGMIQVWPALLVAGVFFAVPQFLISNFHGPWLVNVVASICSMVGVTFFLLRWHPEKIWGHEGHDETAVCRACHGYSTNQVIKAWLPWVILSLLVFIWGIPQIKTFLDSLYIYKYPISNLHNMVMRTPPVVTVAKAEPAVYAFNILSATGTSILVAALISAMLMGYSIAETFRVYLRTIFRVRYSLLTIAAMLALGFTTRYSGLDATLGLTFAKTGHLYPFFGTLLGWLGVALTGSDTSSNVLFGSLQRISAEQLGISSTLMASANSAGGVMGKMIDAQSIVVASTATQWYGHEGDILRYVFFHSLALASLVGILVFLQAYVFPFTLMVVK
ncbi:MAG: L-lactate permease, partial [Desulfomonilaceae bacterium]